MAPKQRCSTRVFSRLVRFNCISSCRKAISCRTQLEAGGLDKHDDGEEMGWHAAVRNFALCLSLLAAMSLVRHVAAGASEVEVEHVDEAEWAILEEAMLQAGAVTRIGEEAGAEQDGDSPGRSLGRQAGGVSDIEDCVPAAAAGCSSKRRREHAALTPLELKRSRGIASIYVTEICSQEWCETQLDFTLRVNKGHVPETTEMVRSCMRGC